LNEHKTLSTTNIANTNVFVVIVGADRVGTQVSFDGVFQSVWSNHSIVKKACRSRIEACQSAGGCGWCRYGEAKQSHSIICSSTHLSFYIKPTRLVTTEASDDVRKKTEQNKTKQNKTKQNKTKQNKFTTKQNKTKQNKTKQNKTKQNKTKTKQNFPFRCKERPCSRSLRVCAGRWNNGRLVRSSTSLALQTRWACE
jgi:hypothetical protein